MGTQTAPNILISLIDIADGLPETGLSVVIVPLGGSLGVDDVVLTEIGVTGKYAKSEADGVDSVDQGVYLIYADSGGGFVYRSSYVHGGEDLETHTTSTSDPHEVVAEQVAVTDIGNHFTGSDVEAVLQEVGVALDDVPTVAAAILLDDSDQTVESVKPKVTNLNADKVDGYHAGNGANQLLVLDADGDVPAANLPAGSPGDASTLNGLAQGQGSNKIPKWNSAGSHNDLDTSMAGKKTTGANGHLALVSIAASPLSTKIHSSFLGKKFPLVAHANNLILQAGWGYKIGGGTQGAIDLSKTFPEAFNIVPIAVLITPVGSALVSGGAPTSLDDFGGALKILSANTFNIDKNGFSVHLYTDTGETLENTEYWGYSWVAIGIKA